MSLRKKSILHSTCIGVAVLSFASISLRAGAQVAPANARLDSAGSGSAVAVLPDSPGTVAAAQQAEGPADVSLVAALNSQTQNQQAQPQSPPTQEQTSSPPQKPVGTAVAPAPSGNGIAASEPAGVAIAPAKQHRVRTLILRTGAIIGAGVAVGTIIALTEATPSKPPGAH